MDNGFHDPMNFLQHLFSVGGEEITQTPWILISIFLFIEGVMAFFGLCLIGAIVGFFVIFTKLDPNDAMKLESFEYEDRFKDEFEYYHEERVEEY